MCGIPLQFRENQPNEGMYVYIIYTIHGSYGNVIELQCHDSQKGL